MSSSNMPTARKAGGLGVRIASNPQWTSFQNKKSPETGCPSLDPETGYKNKGFVVVSKGGNLILFGQNKKWDLSSSEKRELERKLVKNLSCEIVNSMGQDFVQVKNRPDTRIGLDDIGLISALEILISRL